MAFDLFEPFIAEKQAKAFKTCGENQDVGFALYNCSQSRLQCWLSMEKACHTKESNFPEGQNWEKTQTPCPLLSLLDHTALLTCRISQLLVCRLSGF